MNSMTSRVWRHSCVTSSMTSPIVGTFP